MGFGSWEWDGNGIWEWDGIWDWGGIMTNGMGWDGMGWDGMGWDLIWVASIIIYIYILLLTLLQETKFSNIFEMVINKKVQFLLKLLLFVLNKRLYYFLLQ